jgi:NhaA family Na+:H+ antiporter
MPSDHGSGGTPPTLPLPLQALREFLKLESAGGILLLAAAALALVISNSPLASHYETLLALHSARPWVRSRSTSRCCIGSTTV